MAEAFVLATKSECAPFYHMIICKTCPKITGLLFPAPISKRAINQANHDLGIRLINYFLLFPLCPPPPQLLHAAGVPGDRGRHQHHPRGAGVRDRLPARPGRRLRRDRQGRRPARLRTQVRGEDAGGG